MNSIVEDILMHYGMPRRSGRYPYGSGENPYQHSGDFLSRVQELKKSGMSETDIAKNMGLTTTQLRTQMSLATLVTILMIDTSYKIYSFHNTPCKFCEGKRKRRCIRPSRLI